MAGLAVVAAADTHTSWLLTAGVALSGLSSALNGIGNLAKLMSETDPPPWASSMIGGALTLLTSAGASAKLTALAVAPCYISMACGAAWAYSSIAFLHFLYQISCVSSAKLPPKHAPRLGTAEAAAHPVPQWMNLRVYNWAVTGRVGVGKSTLINALRGLRPKDTGAAKVGVCQTTARATPYTYSKDLAGLYEVVRLWDLPGSGCVEFPLETYVRDMGLRYFDGVLLVTSDAFYEHDLQLMRELRKFDVPVYIVRNKIDQAISCNQEDYEIAPDVTVQMVMAEMVGYGCPPDRTFCMTAKYPDRADVRGFPDLLHAMADDLAASRPGEAEAALALEAAANEAAAGKAAAAA